MHEKAISVSIALTVLFGNLLFSQSFEEHPHPFVYTQKRINTAKANIEKHDWAKQLFNKMLESANEAVALSDEESRKWFSEYTPISQCDCPYCGHNWLDYVWFWSKENPDQMKCNYCDNITSLTHFPENDSINIVDPQGNIIPHPVYKDSSGKIFPIRELIFFHKERFAYKWIEELGIVYAITGKKKYAQKAFVLLKRLAEVYAGFGIHDNFRFEPYPFGWAGKLRMWHYTDAYTLKDCAAAYDAIYFSCVMNQADKAFIENNLFRKGIEFLTAVKPSQGISNDIAFRYAGVAMLGRTLEDHDAINWVLEPEEGFHAFVNTLFFKDGTWHERAPGYHTMAARTLHETVEILFGYSDPKTYQGKDRFENIDLTGIKKLANIFSVLLDMRFPDGTLPPVNDGRMGSKPDAVPLEALYNWTGDIVWLEKANQAYEGKLLETGNTYALFNREPDIKKKMKHVNPDIIIPDSSHDFTGMGLFLLRRGKGENQIVFTLHHHKYTSAHTHYDALSTILFANGREMLSDFGYPSFSTPLRTNWYLKTISHNTLTVDTFNQFAPNGVANWLHHGNMFSACEGEAWESYRFTCEPYMRQIALIDGENGQVYAVDIFRGDGGTIHDWALHGEGDSLSLEGMNLIPAANLEGNDYAYKNIQTLQMGKTSASWNAEWTWNDGVSLYCLFPELTNCEIYKALTPGERIKKMRGRKKYSIINRRKGDHVRSEFVGIYEPNSGERFIKSVEKIYVSQQKDWALVLKVYLENTTHYILCSYLDLTPQQIPFIDGNIKIHWQSRFGLVKVQGGKIVEQEWVKGVMEGLRHDF
jgi:hypothetical protein